jgi:hypothetical protein
MRGSITLSQAGIHDPEDYEDSRNDRGQFPIRETA